tara:strand:+ start:3701 stop:4879 length:1179 start_codon:yes stop_codon:yes gene_type:complete
MSIQDLSKSILDASKNILELSEMKMGIQIVPGSERKLMPLAKKAGVRFMKPKPGDDEAHVVGDKKSIMKFQLSRGLSKDDILDVNPELKEESIEEKKLDPVGKADADIDNDGDTDSSDEYLKKRRAAISKAMKDEGNKFSMALKNAKDNDEKEFVVSGKKYTVKEVEDLEHDPKKKNIKEKDVKETTMMSGKPEKKSIAQVRRDMQKSVKDANAKLRDAEMRKKERLRKMATMKEALLPIIEEFGVELISEVLDSVKKFESLDEAGPLGSLGIRQDFERDSAADYRMAQHKKKEAAMKPIDKMKRKLEFMRKQRQVHDDAAEKYRDDASEQRQKAQGKDEATAKRMKEYAEAQELKADRQEEMADDLNFKIQDLKDDIAKLTDKAKDITKRK